MQVELLNDQGLVSSKVDVPDTVFGREYNESLIHQVVVAFRPTPAKVPALKKTVNKSVTRPKSPLSKKVRVALAQV